MGVFSKKILNWYDKAGRKNLPWQENPTPYRVWVSEIMLQQTQVHTVIPYYLNFMQRFPDIKSLAKASLDEVLHLWTGLGYYARARNLHKAANLICERYQGNFPATHTDCVSLPGIGRSTASAILALSQEQRLAILDGNVKRVLCRYFAIHGDPSKPETETKLWALSENLLPNTRLRNYTQALMDLGATVCTRTQPKCEICPVKQDCKARIQEETAILPTPKTSLQKPIKAAQFIIFFNPKKNAVLLEKRPSQGIWGGLFSFPEFSKNLSDKDSVVGHKGSVTNRKHSVKTKDSNKLKLKDLKTFGLNNFNLKIMSSKTVLEFRHTFTHYHLDIKALLCPIEKDNLPLDAKKYHWQNLASKPKVGISAPVQKILKELQCHAACSV